MVVLIANFVCQTLATGVLNGRHIIAIGATQGNHFLCELIPRFLHRRQPFETVDLIGVVRDQLLQAIQLGDNARPGNFIGVEEMLITGQQEPAHTGFHVH